MYQGYFPTTVAIHYGRALMQSPVRESSVSEYFNFKLRLSIWNHLRLRERLRVNLTLFQPATTCFQLTKLVKWIVLTLIIAWKICNHTAATSVGLRLNS